ncbi:hypothetical protein C0J52_10288 [Blattella germanica]|nr:hypothetical protein C0J52_10288 [Blattella germanica]
MHFMLSVSIKRNIQTDVQIREHFNQFTVVLGDMEHSSQILVTGGRPRTGRTPQLEEAIFHDVVEGPSARTRQLALTRNVVMNIWRMLCENLL